MIRSTKERGRQRLKQGDGVWKAGGGRRLKPVLENAKEVYNQEDSTERSFFAVAIHIRLAGGFPDRNCSMKRSKLDGDRGRKDLSQIRVQVTRKQHTDQRIHIDSTPCYLSSIYVVTCLI
jgi:hypothetical protein